MQSESEAREKPRTEAEQKKTPTNEAFAASVYGMPRGIVRACAGVVEALDVLPDRYKQAVARAEESVGQSSVSYTHLDVYKRQLLPYRMQRKVARRGDRFL